jgi:hypothetical protein
MNAIEVLETQHGELDDLFHEISGAKDAVTMRLIVGDISDKLALLGALELHILRRVGAARAAVPRVRDEKVGALVAILQSAAAADRTAVEAKIAALQEEIELDLEAVTRDLEPKLAAQLGEERVWALGAELVAIRRAFESRARRYPPALAFAA